MIFNVINVPDMLNEMNEVNGSMQSPQWDCQEAISYLLTEFKRNDKL